MHTIEAWLKTNTYHHSQFVDLSHLVEEKKKKGLTISLCIPSLNEETTIGKEVFLFKSELQDRYPLIDEIAVVDSGSSDRTLKMAAKSGADVYLAADILPEMGQKKGKGENLWKSVYQLKGDIIVYVDADIKNIHSRFVYGLVAPLIYYPQIKYVKAFYNRPLSLSHEISFSGGGRVTEILIRPFFSLFFPELTAIIQPLSGEYAVRREILERIPFPIGYGVETSHLIDVYTRWGLEAFAQTDLDQRIHRHQSTLDLGKMSFGIQHILFKRLKEMGMCLNLPELTVTFRQFVAQEKEYKQVFHEIYEEERPPMIEVLSYQKKYGIQ